MKSGLKKFGLALAVVLVVIGLGFLFCDGTDSRVEVPEQVVPSVIATVQSAVTNAPAAPATPAEFFESLPREQTASVRGTKPFLLKCEGGFTRSLRLAAESMGARTLGVYSGNELLIEASDAVRARLSADPRFTTTDEFLPVRKVSEELAAMISAGASEVQVTFIALTPEDRELVRQRVAARGGEILIGCLEGENDFCAKVPSEMVSEMSGFGDVRWMERYVRPHLVNDIAVDGPGMNVREVWDLYGLSGAGQWVSTSDSGIDSGNVSTMHPDLADRIDDIKVFTDCNPTDSHGHGTHTAGSIVGNGTKSGGRIRGSAWGARLYAWFCMGTDGGIYVPSHSELFRGNAAGTEWSNAYIHSASWGSSAAGNYISACSEMDRWTWDHPDFLPVYSAGNDGRYGSKTIGSPASSKNVLAVGATQNDRSGFDGGWGNGDPTKIAVFSSHGPCLDGRIKPDISTPGVGVLSTRSHGVKYSYGIYDEWYAYDSGTSMACPLMAGCMALIREWLMARPEFTDANPPTAALMKAIATGGARDKPHPDNGFGWGRADIEETLYPTRGRAVKLVDHIPFVEGTNIEFVIQTTNAAPLDVQLVWIDYPGDASAPQSTAKLVNDLDLVVEQVVGGTGVALYGNGGKAPDKLNNVESVRIANAEPDQYLITVKCPKILYDYTEGGAAALYVRGAFDPAATPVLTNSVCAYRYLGEDSYEKKGEYISLTAALEAAESNDMIRVFGRTRLAKSFKLDKPLKIYGSAFDSTNYDPLFQSAENFINCLNGATLTVASGNRVEFSSLAFKSGNRTSIIVEAGGTGAFSGTLGTGVIKTADANGYEMNGPISLADGYELMLDCAAAPLIGVCGRWTCGEGDTSSAGKVLNANDLDYGCVAQGTSPGSTIIWGLVPVDPAIAGAYVGEGGSKTYYRTLTKALMYVDTSVATEIKVLKNCPPENFTNAVHIVSDVTIRSEGGPFTINPKSTVSFDVDNGGTLTLKDITFSDYTGAGLFRVNAGGTLNLKSGTVLENLTARYPDKYYGPLAVLGSKTGGGGTLNMESGASIRGCSVTGEDKGYGGGVYVLYGTANLLGGEIINCQALTAAGGVYAYCGDKYAKVNLGGDLTVTNNTSGSNTFSAGNPDDLWIRNGNYTFTVQSPLSGRIGIKSAGSPGVKSNEVFGVAASSSAAEGSLGAFFMDGTEGFHAVHEVVDGADKLVWGYKEPDGQCDPADAVCQIVYPDSTVCYYDSPNAAFDHVSGECTIELLRDCNLTADVTVKDRVVLRTDPNYSSTYTLGREAACSVNVIAGASLTLTDIFVYGNNPLGGDSVSKRFFAVNGGELILQADTTISGVIGSTSRADGAVVCWNGGHFVMEDGSSITGCICTWNGDAADYAIGAGVLVEGLGTTAEFRGGYVAGCMAVKGAGVAICNKSTSRVSGSFSCDDNTDLNGDSSDFLVEDLSEMYLDSELASGASIGRIEGVKASTNVFGKVEDWTAWSSDSLTNSAAKFFHDLRLDVGVVATNGTKEALLVWRSAVNDDGVIEIDGEEYRAIALPDMPIPPPPPPPPPPPQFEVITNTPTPIAFSAISRADDVKTCTITLTNLVKNANYSLYTAQTLEGGFKIESLKPYTNFNAEASGAFTITIPSPVPALFWRATGKTTYTTNYLNNSLQK